MTMARMTMARRVAAGISPPEEPHGPIAHPED
jgi:hypothetical protein